MGTVSQINDLYHPFSISHPVSFPSPVCAKSSISLESLDSDRGKEREKYS